MEERPCGTRVLLLPHHLLSSSCRSDLDRPIVHSDLFFLCSLSLFFVVRSFLSSSSLDCSSLLHQIVQIVQSPTQIYSSSLLRRCSSSSNRWFFFRSILHRQIVGSSSVLLFFKYQNRVLETRICFLELESLRLEIYVTFLSNSSSIKTRKASL